MCRSRNTKSLFAAGILAILFVGTSARAQSTAETETPNLTITMIKQGFNNQALIFTSPAPNTSCNSGNQPFIINNVNSINADLPGYKSVMPIIMGAFLYGKPIHFELKCQGPTSANYPHVKAATIVQ